MRKKLVKVLSFLLAIAIVMSDSALLQVMATEKTVTGEVIQEQSVEETVEETVEESTEKPLEDPTDDPVETTTEEKQDDPVEDLPEEKTEAVKRQPENFYPEEKTENYGTLAAYDEYSRTYQVEENQYVTIIGYDGNTYIDDDGNLQQTDNTLVEDPMSAFSGISTGARYINAANDFLAVLSGETSENNKEILTIATDDHMLSVAPTAGVFKDGITSGNAIRYSNVFANTDFQYTLIGNRVKEDIILLSKEASNCYSYELNTYGLKAELIRNTLYIYEEGTNPELDAVFILEAPEMIDAADEISFGIRMDVSETDNGYLVTVTADKEWLSAAERVYPVRIDPTAIQVSQSAIHVACAEEGSPTL